MAGNSEHNGTDDSEALLRSMESERGYIYPAHRYLANAAPEFLRAYNALAGEALLHGERSEGDVALPGKYRELVVSGILAFKGAAPESIAVHLRRALELGATKQEMLEAFEASVIPGGAPAMLAGVRALMVLEETPS